MTASPSPTAPRRPPARDAARAVLTAVSFHPSLWPTALAQARRLARRGWWRGKPPLPLPDDDLWRFRMETAYGGRGDATPSAADIRSYLRWCREMRSSSRWR